MKVEITKIVERPVLTAEGKIVPTIAVSYRTERGFAGTLEMPKDEFTKEKALAKIREEARGIEDLLSAPQTL